MATNPANVSVAVTGAVYATGPGATVAAAPTTAVTVLDVALKDLGYIGEKGVVEHYEEGTTEIKAWQGGAVVRSMISDSKATFSFVMIENKKEAVELYHKGSTIVADGGTGKKINVMTPNADPRQFCLDVIDGTEHMRIWIESGEVTKREDIAYVGTDAIAYGVEITAYPIAGVVCTKFTDSTSWA